MQVSAILEWLTSTEGLVIIEGLSILWMLWAVRRRPKSHACFWLLVSAACGSVYASFAFDGADAVGRKTMLAAVYAPETAANFKVATVPIPSHTGRSILIKVEAAALNPSNFKMLPAQIPFLRHLRQWVIGYDVAGTVVSVGDHPDCDVKVGDRVWGMALTGSIAEYATMSCYEIVGMSLIPSKMSFEHAAGLPVAGLTGLAAYERNGLRKGDDVLVIGASGGCGMFGVTIAAHAFNANVTGLCSTKNVDFVRGLGAAHVVDYRVDAEMTRLTKAGPQFDVIYDTVTSSAPEDPDYEPAMRPLLKPGGRYVAIGPSPNPLDLLRGGLDVITQLFGVRLQREGYDMFLLSPSRSRHRTLTRFFEDGLLPDVVVDSTFTISSDADMVRAMDRMKSRRVVGKIIVKMAPQ